MQVIMDDSVIVLVYALMAALIIALFVGAYYLYKKVSARPEPDRMAASDKLTSNQADRVGASQYEKYDN